MQPRFIKLHQKTKIQLKQKMAEAAVDGHKRVAKRIHAVLLNSDGRTSTEIAKVLHASRGKVSEWLKIYDCSGFQELLEGERSGRPPLLTDLQKILLCDILDSGPVAYGLMTGIWTSKVISEVIESEFKVSYHPGHVRKLLQGFGYSVQTPKRLLAAADKEKRDKWVAKTYPEIKKKLTRKERGSSSKMRPVLDRTPLYIEPGHELAINQKLPN